MSIKKIVSLSAQNSFLALQDDPMLKNMGRLPTSLNKLQLVRDGYDKVVTGLSPEEQKSLEQRLFLKPNELNGDSNFWNVSEFKAGITIPNAGLELDLSDPKDELKWKLLMAMEIIQTGNLRKASDQFVVIDEEEKSRNFVEQGKKKSKMFALYANWNIKNKRDLLYALGIGVKGLSETKLDELCLNQIELNPNTCLDLVTSDTYSKLVEVQKLRAVSIITYSNPLMQYEFEGELLGESIGSVVKTLSVNGEKVAALIARMREQFKRKAAGDEYLTEDLLEQPAETAKK